MSDVLQHEKALYEKVWGIKEYAAYSPGELYLPRFLALAGSELKPNHVVLDAGCGSGKAALAMKKQGINVELMDFAIANSLTTEAVEAFVAQPESLYNVSLYDDPAVNELTNTFDWFYCCDVMEHIPPEKVDEVLQNLANLVTVGGFFSISCRPDGFGKRVGEALHKTVKNVAWWKSKLAAYFEIEHCSGGDECFFLVKSLAKPEPELPTVDGPAPELPTEEAPTRRGKRRK